MDFVVGEGFTGQGFCGEVEPAGSNSGAVRAEDIGGKGVADEKDFFFRTGFDVGEDVVEEGLVWFLGADFFRDEKSIDILIQTGAFDAFMLCGGDTVGDDIHPA